MVSWDDDQSSKGILKEIVLQGAMINDGVPSTTTSHVGVLVGENRGTLRRIKVTESSVTCSVSCGLIAGYSSGVIEYANVEGSVLATSYRGGGVVGDLWGILSYARSAADITGVNYNGGIAGMLYRDGTNFQIGEINDSYFVGSIRDIEGVLGDQVGGIVGRMDQGIIRRTYAKAAVSAPHSDNVGGAIGRILHGLVSDS